MGCITTLNNASSNQVRSTGGGGGAAGLQPSKSKFKTTNLVNTMMSKASRDLLFSRSYGTCSYITMCVIYTSYINMYIYIYRVTIKEIDTFNFM